MNILVVCQYYFPEQFQVTGTCEELARRGHSVTVLTGLPNYPAGRIPMRYRFGRKRRETINEVDVVRSCEIGRHRGASGLMLNYLSFMVSASFKALALRRDFDIIFVYQLSPITMAVPAVLLRRMSKKPLFLYCLDIWPESVRVVWPDGRAPLFRLVKWISTKLYSQCDAIAVTSRPFIDYLIKVHGIPRDRITYIPQYAECALGEVSPRADNSCTDFVYMGNIGIAQDVDCILSAVEQMKHVPGFMVHFVGDGSYESAAKTAASLKGLNGVVVFHGRHPVEEMSRFYAMADACLLTLRDDNMTGMTIPSRLQGYMAAAKPVIGAIGGAAKSVIEESGCGVCVSPGDAAGLAAAMIDFVEHPGEYSDCGSRGRAYYTEHFSKNAHIEALEQTLRMLSDEAPRV